MSSASDSAITPEFVREIVADEVKSMLSDGRVDSIRVGENTVRIKQNDIELSGSISTEAGATVFDGANLRIGSDLVDTTSIDTTISPTFSNQFTFNGGLELGDSIDMGNNRITNLPSPDGANQPATKGFVESIEQGLDVKDSVRASPTENIDLTSTADPNPVDGITLNDGDRVLLQAQTDAAENGIYDAVTAADPTTWVRSADADEDSEISGGLFTFAREGNANGNQSFVLTTSGSITLGTTDLDFTEFSTAGELIGGDGIFKDGNEINVVPGDFAGTFLTTTGSPANLAVSTGLGLEGDGSGSIRTAGNDIAGGFLSEGGSPHEVSVNIGAGLEADGSNNIRVSGQAISGAFLAEGAAANQVSVQVGAGLQGDGNGRIEVDTDALSHNNLSGISSDDHHTRYDDQETRDAVAAQLVAGTDITLSRDTSNNTLEIASGAAFTDEDAQDAVGGITDTSLAYDDAAPSLGVATDGVGTDELDESASYTFTTVQRIERGEPSSGAVSLLELTDTSTNDDFRATLTSAGVFVLSTADSSSGTTTSHFRLDPAATETTVGATIVPNTNATHQIGTASLHFNEMHATQFITHSPEARSPETAWASLDDYESGSMEIEEKVADLIAVVKEQRAEIETLREELAG